VCESLTLEQTPVPRHIPRIGFEVLTRTELRRIYIKGHSGSVGQFGCAFYEMEVPRVQPSHRGNQRKGTAFTAHGGRVRSHVPYPLYQFHIATFLEGGRKVRNAHSPGEPDLRRRKRFPVNVPFEWISGKINTAKTGPVLYFSEQARSIP
jgi:hypothetical protein